MTEHKIERIDIFDVVIANLVKGRKARKEAERKLIEIDKDANESSVDREGCICEFLKELCGTDAGALLNMKSGSQTLIDMIEQEYNDGKGTRDEFEAIWAYRQFGPDHLEWFLEELCGVGFYELFQRKEEAWSTRGGQDD